MSPACRAPARCTPISLTDPSTRDQDCQHHERPATICLPCDNALLLQSTAQGLRRCAQSLSRAGTELLETMQRLAAPYPTQQSNMRLAYTLQASITCWTGTNSFAP